MLPVKAALVFKTQPTTFIYEENAKNETMRTTWSCVPCYLIVLIIVYTFNDVDFAVLKMVSCCLGAYKTKNATDIWPISPYCPEGRPHSYK